MKSMYKVYVTDFVFPDLVNEKRILEPLGVEVIGLQCKDRQELMIKAPDAHALLNTYLGKIDGEVMDAMPGLRVIVRYGIGYDSIDVKAATDRGIFVANVPDYCIEEVSDHAVALTLSLIRKIPASDYRIKRNSDYSIAWLKPIMPLQGAQIGLIGFGRIGRRIAEKLAAFNPKLSFYDPYFSDDSRESNLPTQKKELDELLETSDIIILQAPLTKENRHMLNRDAFQKMIRKPYIINTARGELIHTEALVEALQAGIISGAALDVVEGMPPVPKGHPLLDMEQVLLTPHSAWISENSNTRLQILAAEEVARVFKGERPKALINRELLPGQYKKGKMSLN